jgi:hypothetical protein
MDTCSYRFGFSLVKHVVLHIALNLLLLKQAVVFFRSISCICGKGSGALPKLLGIELGDIGIFRSGWMKMQLVTNAKRLTLFLEGMIINQGVVIIFVVAGAPLLVVTGTQQGNIVVKDRLYSEPGIASVAELDHRHVI